MKRSISPTDFFAIKKVSDPQVSPDGSRIAFVVSQPDLKANREQSAVYLVPIRGGAPRQITHGDKRDAAPRWSPDGSQIAFTSTRSGSTQIWVLDLSGGEARQLTRFKASLGGALWANNSHAWSPDGKWIACVSRGDVEADAPTLETDMRIVERTFYKWSGGFNPNRPTHIWVVPVEGGDPRQLTDDDQDDHSLCWSPDSSEIAFVSNRTGDWDNNANNDLFAVSLRTGRVRCITDTPGPEFTPAWSPDGKWIACAASDRENTSKDSPAGSTEIYVVPADGGAPWKLSGALDRRSGSPVWSPDGKWIYFSAADGGARHAYRVSPDGKMLVQITRGPCQITSFSLSAQHLVCTLHDEAHPAEIHRFDLNGEKGDPLTDFNAAWCAEIRTVQADPFTFSTFDGLTVHGWVLKPAEFEEGQHYPAVLSIHGGPHGAYGHTFRPAHQALSGAGYGVVYLNPRGSAGYGQAFADGCVGDWGGGDYRDLMLGLDAALERHPWIDPDHLGVTGGSYGGFMTNWIVTQTHRFKAGVSHAGLSNHVSFYGTSMYQLLMEYEFQGKPWEAHDAYWQRSPLAHVQNARTPLLLTHGEIDHDVPIGQAEEFFIALKKRGVPTAFIRYPREGHGISEPAHSKDFIQRTIAWFDRYLKPDELHVLKT